MTKCTHFIVSSIALKLFKLVNPPRVCEYWNYFIKESNKNFLKVEQKIVLNLRKYQRVICKNNKIIYKNKEKMCLFYSKGAAMSKGKISTLMHRVDQCLSFM